MKKFFSIVSAAALLISAVSCKDYLDINYDPNVPAAENITADMIFPGVEMALAASYGDYLRIVGGYYCEHYAHQFGTSNYVDYSQFTMSATRSSSTYSQLFQKGLLNIKTIQQKASAANQWGTYLAATTLRAFIYQALVDCYGEVPYSEALDDGNLTPKYDDGADIYKGIVAELDEALSKVVSTDLVCTSFLYPGETAEAWIKFANAVKLRILMRECKVTDVKSQLAALVAENNFPTEDVEFAGCWAQEAGKESPFFGEEFSTLGGSTQINVIANIALVGTMQVKDSEGSIVYTDPRLEAFFNPNKSGNYEGGVSGTNFSTADKPYATTDNWCRPVASYDMPVSLMSVSEVEFFLAEYYARYGSASDAADHYAAAVEASFASAGVEGADQYLARYPYNNAKYAEVIGLAKWVALSGVNPFEAYCEVRRLDYPSFGTVKGSDLFKGSGVVYSEKYVAGYLYTPYQVFGEIGENKLLERFPYAESSQSRNSNCPTFPGYTSPIFWGK